MKKRERLYFELKKINQTSTWQPTWGTEIKYGVFAYNLYISEKPSALEHFAELIKNKRIGEIKKCKKNPKYFFDNYFKTIKTN